MPLNVSKKRTEDPARQTKKGPSPEFSDVGTTANAKSIMADDVDAKLDVNSADFDPLLALYSDRLVLPRPDALVLDNVAKFESLQSKCGKLVRFDKLVQQMEAKREAKASTSSEAQKLQSVKDLSPPSVGKKRRKPLKNVLTRITDASGPLGFLRECMEKRIRIKVWTRNATGIRGYCLGFVVAFDKHWNLALTDVREVWLRKVKRKMIHLGEGFDFPLPWKAMGPVAKPPEVVVLKTEKGMQTCERHVNQMLMRGEHIAFISVLDA